MKIRTDFVTNSSSSSFIAVFGKQVDKDLAENSKEIYSDDIFTGKYLKENWNRLKSEFTSEWCGIDPWISKDEVEDDKLYFAYWSGRSLTESTDYNQSDGYDNDEIEEHQNDVDKELEYLKGFDLKFSSWQGRDG